MSQEKPTPNSLPGNGGRSRRRRIFRSRGGRIFLWTAAILVIVLVAGHFALRTMIRHKVDAAIRDLPPSLQVSYGSLDPGLLTGSLDIRALHVIFSPAPGSRQQLSIDHLAVRGIRIFALLFSHRLQARSVRLEGCIAALDEDHLNKDQAFPKVTLPFTEVSIGQLEIAEIVVTLYKETVRASSLNGSMVLDDLHIADCGKSLDTGNVRIGNVRLAAKDIRYTIPGANEQLRLTNTVMNSQEGALHIDSARIVPSVDRIEAGRRKGRQVDYLETISEGIAVNKLDVPALLQHRFIAASIEVKKNHIYVFRDRRLPRATDKKPLPVDYLKSLPLSIRVQSVRIGPSTVRYEEFPGKGNKTGELKIIRLHGTLTPLINHPADGDPAYMTMAMEGSLEGSGSVTAVTKMPLHKGDPYQVEGAFHQLDVTRLNSSAENLGLIHLESGILNSLAFRFDMNEEHSTGKIVGEYHDLVIQKLRMKNDERKVDKLKSFFLQKLIIPRDKDRSLPVAKRTGKVDYKHDPSRNFSYYMLHSLLVGVKSSFSLGFLLPG